jgi:hypothetical protein
VTLGIGYGQSVSLACVALINRLIELGEANPTKIARAAVRHQSGVIPEPVDRNDTSEPLPHRR